MPPNNKCYPSLQNHMIHAWSSAIFLIVLGVTAAFISYVYGVEHLPLVLSVAGTYVGIVVALHAAIHIRYMLVSKGKWFQFDIGKRQTIIHENGETRIISDDDVLVVEVVLHRSLSRNELAFYPWQTYGYALIRLKSGDCILITTLALPKLDWPYEFRNVVVSEKLYPWPS